MRASERERERKKIERERDAALNARTKKGLALLETQAYDLTFRQFKEIINREDFVNIRVTSFNTTILFHLKISQLSKNRKVLKSPENVYICVYHF